MATRNSSLPSADQQNQHIFDIPHVRALLIALYTIIFIFCCVGNLAVVLVVTFHSGMRNMTKFLLGNVAFANLCVGIFCVYQSLTTYLYDSWFYGDFMCRMHHFSQSLCHTASILVLVAIAVERYLVLLCPLKSRQMMSFRRLVALIAILWISSAAIASPRLYYFGTILIPIRDHPKETICIPRRTLYDSATADTIYFLLLYVFPLTIISILYARIAKHLHRSETLRQSLNEAGHGQRDGGRTENSEHYDGRGDMRCESVKKKRKHRKSRLFCCRKPRLGPSFKSSWTSMSAKGSPTGALNQSRKVMLHHAHNSSLKHGRAQGIEATTKALKTKKRRSKVLRRSTTRRHRHVNRRRLQTNTARILLNQRLYAIRVLVVIVVTFAVLNLPFHVRKLCLNYLPSYDADSDVNHLLTPLTFLLMYTNCALSPILYGFLSKKFRQSFLDLIFMRRRRGLRNVG